MCGSMADIQCATAEIRRGKKKERKKEEKKKKPQDENIMASPTTQGGHKYYKWMSLTDTMLINVMTTDVQQQDQLSPRDAAHCLTA